MSTTEAAVAEASADKKYLTADEVAADLRISITTAYALLREGGVPRIRVRGQWRIPTDRYRRWQDGEEDLSRQQPQVIPLRRKAVGR